MEFASRPPWLWPRAAYVHVPFCAHHCGYCDFAVAVGQDHLIDTYLDALAAELATLGTAQAVATLFLGGGTPTHLDADRLDRLLRDVRRWLVLDSGGEFSIEANPDTLDAGKFAVLTKHGVTRVSLGAQLFQPEVLHVLERAHRPDQVAPAVRRIKDAGLHVSLDLIFGAPGQTLAQWQADLRAVLALAPDHVSTYGLTYEKGTRLWKQRRQGEIHALDEEAELAMYLEAMDVLGEAGFEHYEISNFARPGCRSRHNQAYWANEAHWGFGLGAASYIGGRRNINTRDLQSYLKRALAAEPTAFQSESLPPEESARETMAQNLRRAEGIDRLRFRAQTGIDFDALAGSTINELVALELLADDGQRVSLTRRGKCVADAVVERLFVGR